MTCRCGARLHLDLNGVTRCSQCEHTARLRIEQELRRESMRAHARLTLVADAVDREAQQKRSRS